MDSLGRRIARSVEQAVSDLTGLPVELDYLRAGLLRRGDLAGYFEPSEEPVVAIEAGLTGTIGGCLLMHGKEEEVWKIGSKIASPKRPRVHPKAPEPDSASVSAFAETVHVIGNVALTTIGKALGISMVPSAPRVIEATTRSLGTLLERSLWPDDKCLFTIQLRLALPGAGSSVFTLVVGIPSMDRMMESLNEYRREEETAVVAATPARREFVQASDEETGLGEEPIPAGLFTPGLVSSVLVVDDSAYFRAKISRWLRMKGVKQVLECGDGESAVELYRTTLPELTLLDIVMAGKSGLDVLREIKKLDPEAKVVIISAVGQESLQDGCRRAGANDIIEKPVKLERLIQTIDQVTHYG